MTDEKVVTLNIPKKQKPVSTDWITVTKEPIKLDIHPDKVLEAAKGTLKTAIIVGENKQGFITVLSSQASRAETCLLLDQAKAWLLKS